MGLEELTGLTSGAVQVTGAELQDPEGKRLENCEERPSQVAFRGLLLSLSPSRSFECARALYRCRARSPHLQEKSGRGDAVNLSRGQT